MPIYDNLNEFVGQSVVDYDPERGLDDPAGTSYRVRLDWSAYDSGKRLPELLERLVADPGAGSLRQLVIGAWDFEQSYDASGIIQTLVEHRAELATLEALFIGDITSEETEISWIQQSDFVPVLLAFPKLRVLRVRGSPPAPDGSVRHLALQHFAIESGGLRRGVTERVATAHLPNLEHLELWLGDDNYGYEPCLDALAPLLEGVGFPKLSYLGLKNCEEEDAIAAAVARSAIIDRIQVLDLSLGTLSDAGAEALLASGKLSRLKKLDITHHYVSEPMLERLARAVPKLDAGDPQTADMDGDVPNRYVAVSE
jgi:hypothetical protein